MRIISWNCKQDLAAKWTRLQALSPNLTIVQECASPEQLAKRGLTFSAASCLWTTKANARDANKGLGVFAGEGVSIRPSDVWEAVKERWRGHPYRLDVLLPFEVTSPCRLNVLAVWSFNNRHEPGKMNAVPGPVLVALDELRDWLNSEPSLVIGDFNNHARWDTRKGQNNFGHHLATMDRLGLRSAYHILNGVAHGQETENTHLWRVGMPYHIDYAFVCEALLSQARCRIEPLDAWCGRGGVSDHAPLVLEIS